MRETLKTVAMRMRVQAWKDQAAALLAGGATLMLGLVAVLASPPPMRMELVLAAAAVAVCVAMAAMLSRKTARRSLQPPVRDRPALRLIEGGLSDLPLRAAK
jgi:membrane protein implicated in regulation of membrane protease activity